MTYYKKQQKCQPSCSRRFTSSHVSLLDFSLRTSPFPFRSPDLRLSGDESSLSRGNVASSGASLASLHFLLSLWVSSLGGVSLVSFSIFVGSYGLAHAYGPRKGAPPIKLRSIFINHKTSPIMRTNGGSLTTIGWSTVLLLSHGLARTSGFRFPKSCSTPPFSLCAGPELFCSAVCP